MILLTRISNRVAYVERWASRAIIFGFVALIIVNVGLRYLAGRPLVYAEEIAAIMLVWLAFISISISIHDRAQVSVTLVTDMLDRRASGIIAVLVSVCMAAIVATLLWSAIGWVNSPGVEFEQVITTGWPKAPFFMIVPIFCATCLVHLLAIIFNGEPEVRQP
ncbi:MAG: TRAP transporter small permease [Allorhizobium sp.]